MLDVILALVPIRVRAAGMGLLRRLHSVQKIRFMAVGVLNTLFDYSLFTLLVQAGVLYLFANSFSTLAALTLSYFLNFRFVFKGDRHRVRTMTLFFVVTLFGLWVLQNGMLALLIGAADGSSLLSGLPEVIRLNVLKLLASTVSVVWNYTMYKYVVFRGAVGMGRAA